MVLCNFREEYQCEDVVFIVGGVVYGLQGSAYSGLVGEIKEIRTDEDKETENPKADIYVDFKIPIRQKDRNELEKRFSDIHGKTMCIEDINLDSVIMSPRSVAPLQELRKRTTDIVVFLLREDWTDGENCGSYFWAFSDYADAEQKMRNQLAMENSIGLLARWKDDENYVVSEQEDCFECWLDGRYNEAHYSLSITIQDLFLSSNTVTDICNAQIAEGRAEDFLEEISQWEETEDLTEEQLAEMVQFTDIPNRIKEKLSTNSTYWSAYYESLSEASYEAVQAYLAHLRSEADPRYEG